MRRAASPAPSSELCDPSEPLPCCLPACQPILQRRNVCACMCAPALRRVVSCPPPIQFACAHRPSTPGRLPLPSPQHGQRCDSQSSRACVALEGRQKSRNAPRCSCSCSVLASGRRPWASQIATRGVCDLQPCSLPASRNCYRRPVRPSRSFAAAIPTIATHATRHPAMHDTPAPPCAGSPRCQIFPPLPRCRRAINVLVSSSPGCSLPPPDRERSSASARRRGAARKAAEEQARELASAETLAPAHPISSQTSIALPHHNQKHTCRAP